MTRDMTLGQSLRPFVDVNDDGETRCWIDSLAVVKTVATTNDGLVTIAVRVTSKGENNDR